MRRTSRSRVECSHRCAIPAPLVTTTGIMQLFFPNNVRNRNSKKVPFRPTFTLQAFRAVEQFQSYMKIPLKLKFIQSDRYGKNSNFHDKNTRRAKSLSVEGCPLIALVDNVVKQKLLVRKSWKVVSIFLTYVK